MLLNSLANGGAAGASAAASSALYDSSPPRKGGSLPHLRRLLQITTCVIIIASSITAASLATYGGSGGGSACVRSGDRLLQLLPRGLIIGSSSSSSSSDGEGTEADAGAAGFVVDNGDGNADDDNTNDDIFLDIDSNARFLIIAGVTEQLGKAIYHMEDLFELCLLSNRTCVLPGIAGGQFALDGALDFGDIFDMRSLPPALRTIQWDRFAKYFRRRFGAGGGGGGGGGGGDKELEPKASKTPPHVTMCAVGKAVVSDRMVTVFERTAQYYQPSATFAMDPACETSMIGFPADRQKQVVNLEAVMSVLSGQGDGGGPADHDEDDDDDTAATAATTAETNRPPPPPPQLVAMFHYEWSEPFPRPTLLKAAGYTGLDFSPRFYAQAGAFRAQVGDYIHLQWRMEKADGGKDTNYTACALAAIRHIRDLSNKTGISQVYFSSDLGRDGVPWSNSFAGSVPNDALNALGLIYGEFPRLLTWLNVTSPMLSPFDTASVGVMDRLIAMGSTYFVRGPKECSRVGAYVQSIAKWRKKRLEAAGDGGGDGKDGGQEKGGQEDNLSFGSRIMNAADEFAL